MTNPWEGREDERRWRESCYDQRLLRREIEPYLPDSGALLDVGCGHKKMRNHVGNLDYVGLDFNAGFDPHILADSTHIPVDANSFDVVLAKNHLQHVREWTETVDELLRIAREKVIVFENCHTNATTVVDERHGGVPLIRFNIDDLIAALGGVDRQNRSEIDPKLHVLVTDV